MEARCHSLHSAWASECEKYLVDPINRHHYHKEWYQHVLEALKHGFRPIDTAEEYQNEEFFKSAFDKWGGKREDVFITAKSLSLPAACQSY